MHKKGADDDAVFNEHLASFEEYCMSGDARRQMIEYAAGRREDARLIETEVAYMYLDRDKI